MSKFVTHGSRAGNASSFFVRPGQKEDTLLGRRLKHHDSPSAARRAVHLLVHTCIAALPHTSAGTYKALSASGSRSEQPSDIWRTSSGATRPSIRGHCARNALPVIRLRSGVSRGPDRNGDSRGPDCNSDIAGIISGSGNIPPPWPLVLCTPHAGPLGCRRPETGRPDFWAGWLAGLGRMGHTSPGLWGYIAVDRKIQSLMSRFPRANSAFC
ncbi:hypothetical protein B0T26DRAFT_345668 [Lasiosphaeria miniovina]|uniref:Uncharacterized protein n=1 Tax=Lasiosphaeria miniovina TaxID=1954250 RepID=A0AA40DTG3_9PEZI|nr:uncharacterized protein B0T26DRAFT_345668 [Lasiosphaeria miniovina]KAK0712821.1 hypothetical protein B0T26DRAFT_345668 [Lasiosphaeria miniovina]